MPRLLVVVVLVGCTSLIPPMPPGREPTDECRQAEDEYLVCHGFAIGLTGAAGAVGSGGILSATIGESVTVNIVMAALATAFGLGGTITEVMCAKLAERAVEACAEE
jgi:hypothetical protein